MIRFGVRAAGIAAMLYGLALPTLGIAGGPDEPKSEPEPYQASAGPCPTDRNHCVAIVLHMATLQEVPVQTAQWVHDQLQEANRLFKALDLGLEIGDVELMPEETARIETREDRDLLGRKRHTWGVIHVFVVAYLANVDEPGAIWGVHWRDREETSHRWVILSAESWSLTLAHELGHFFGLKHASKTGSLMNKTGKDETPRKERCFLNFEVATMYKKLKRKLKSGTLKDRFASE